MNLRKLRDWLYRQWIEVRKPKRDTYDGVDPEGYYFIHDSIGDRRVFVSHPRRLGYYREGVEVRLANLAREYCVNDLVFTDSDRLVDVGAHSGELGLWAERFGLNYLGIEPDPVAFGALKRNLPGAFLEQVAVGAEDGSAEFSLATSTGDSSLTVGRGKTISVKIEKLDDVVSRSFPGGKIDLLKIEAEGFEPEVLSGATETLKRTSLLTVDAGAERLGESTAPACVNLLLDSGFKLRRVFLRRGIFLFSSDLFTGVL